MNPQIGRNTQNRGVWNALSKSHPRDDAPRKAERQAHPQSPSDEKHWSGTAKTSEMVLPRHKTPSWKLCRQSLPRSFLQRPRAIYPRKVCEKTQRSKSLPQSTEHRTVVIGVQSAVWRERGDEESWASTSSKLFCEVRIYNILRSRAGVFTLKMFHNCRRLYCLSICRGEILLCWGVSTRRSLRYFGSLPLNEFYVISAMLHSIL